MPSVQISMVKKNYNEFLSGCLNSVSYSFSSPLISTVLGQKNLQPQFVSFNTRSLPNSPIVQPTIDAIKERLRGKYKVKIYSLPREELEQWIKDGKVDIFLSSAGFYPKADQ